MSVSFSSGNGKTYRRNFMDRPTKHRSQETLPGDRYSPTIQPRYREGAFRVAPYLPFQFIKKDFFTYVVIRAHTIIGVDMQGYVVPCNGILPVGDGTQFYEGRPLVYADRDHSQLAFGDWPDTDAPKNLNVYDGEPLEAADVNTEGVVEGVAGTGGDDAGKAGLAFAAVSAMVNPMGVLTDEALEGASRFIFNEMDPQESLTMQTMYTLIFAERNEMRYNYGQATRNAIITRNALVGQGTDANLDNVGANAAGAVLDTTLPFWATQGEADEGVATLNDIITPGDLVACDDSGNPVRFDARVDDWNVAHDDASGQFPNNRYPVAAMVAVVGRCHAREHLVNSTPLSKVKTYQSEVLGGSGTDGIETYLTRGDEMTAGQVTALIAARKPESGAADAYVSRDALAGRKYAVSIHLTNL